jgi:5'-methylthioadenosine phosphorylase
MSPQLPTARIGVIGGTGLENIEGMTEVQDVNPETPFGPPSDAITVGRLNGVGVAFLPRHGRGHFLLPSEVPSRANIYALKMLGVERTISLNSCGSFKENIKPGDLVIPDQVIDRTRNRVSTFFGNGIVAHIGFSQPFCPELSWFIYSAAQECGATVHRGGTFIAMEGPAFSTKAESRLYQSWNADIVGMTVLPEAKLAREAEICYASIALVTDYDCWRERTEPVTVEVILTCMLNNVEMAKKIIKLAVGRIAAEHGCECGTALANAIVTAPDKIPAATKASLHLITGKYLK